MTTQTTDTITTEEPTHDEIATLERELDLYLTFWAKAREPEEPGAQPS